MIKKFFIGLMFVSLIIFIFWSIRSGFKQSHQTDKLQVVASFYPLAHFTEQVGGNLVAVTNTTPAGVEPHEFEPSAQDIIQINQAKLFIYNGFNFDPWADQARNDVLANNKTVLKMSDQLSTTNNDPHFWLSPILAKQEVNLIKEALIKIDPNNSRSYQSNTEDYLGQLDELDRKYQTSLSSCQLRDIITSHNAFGYLAKEYGLNQIAITGISPEEEPSAQKLVEISDLARQKNIQYIFFEKLINPKLSETIAKEIGAATLTLNPIEGFTDEEIKAGATYLLAMRENLTNLQKALQCQ